MFLLKECKTQFLRLQQRYTSNGVSVCDGSHWLDVKSNDLNLVSNYSHHALSLVTI